MAVTNMVAWMPSIVFSAIQPIMEKHQHLGILMDAISMEVMVYIAFIAAQPALEKPACQVIPMESMNDKFRRSWT